MPVSPSGLGGVGLQVAYPYSYSVLEAAGERSAAGRSAAHCWALDVSGNIMAAPPCSEPILNRSCTLCQVTIALFFLLFVPMRTKCGPRPLLGQAHRRGWTRVPCDTAAGGAGSGR